jgi:hypothetical protein
MIMNADLAKKLRGIVFVSMISALATGCVLEINVADDGTDTVTDEAVADVVDSTQTVDESLVDQNTTDQTGTTTVDMMYSAALSWTPPTTRTDGTSLSDLAGYKIHYGPSADNLSSQVDINDVGISSYTVENLQSGTYYFAITAYDGNGTESVYSNVVSKAIGG